MTHVGCSIENESFSRQYREVKLYFQYSIHKPGVDFLLHLDILEIVQNCYSTMLYYVASFLIRFH